MDSLQWHEAFSGSIFLQEVSHNCVVFDVSTSKIGESHRVSQNFVFQLSDRHKNHGNLLILNASICFIIFFLPSPAHVSINLYQFWGCQSSSLELGMQVWLCNPAYFFCSMHFCTESAKRCKKCKKMQKIAKRCKK